MAKDFRNLIKGTGKKDDLISHLIRGTTQKDEEYTLIWLPHDKVYSVAQARKKFKNIEGLATSMKGRQQLQAITVYPADADGRHRIKTGERRWRASVLNDEPVLAIILNNEKMPDTAEQGSEQLKRRYDQIKENDQREPLTPMEMAVELGNLRDQFKLKPGQIADGIGRPAAYVSKHLKLLEMPDEVQNLMEDGVVTYIETLNILTNVFAVSENAGHELIETIRQKGELTRSEAQEYLKALKSSNSGGKQQDTNDSQVPDSNGSQLPDNNSSQLPDNNGSQLSDNNSSQLPDNNGSQLSDNNGSQLPDNNGSQLPDNNGSQLPDNNGSQLPDNNGSQLPDNNGSQLPDNNGSQLPDNNVSQLPDNNSSLLPGNNAVEEQPKQLKANVTFYVKIDDSVFELMDKPSIIENEEVYVFCREREGMPEIQVPINECTLHHASLTK